MFQNLKVVLCTSLLATGIVLINQSAAAIDPPSASKQVPEAIQSPNRKLVAQIVALSSNNLSCEISVDGTNVMVLSELGVVVNGTNFGRGVTLGKPVERKIYETYPLPGWHAVATNQCIEALFPVVHIASGQEYKLAVRIFNDGAAIRYLLPFAGTNFIEGETTTWQIPGDAEAWWAPMHPSYEEIFRGSKFSEIGSGRAVGAPVTLRLPDSGLYIAVTEADTENYPDMAFQRVSNGLRSFFWASPKGWTNEGPLTTPWRVALIAPDLTTLVNSDIIANLCPPPSPELANADWIQPGRALWHWLSDGSPKFEEQHAWFDGAAKLGWEYYLIDDGWRRWQAPDKDQWQCLKEVIDYGKTVGVKTLVWVNSKEMIDAKSRRNYLEKVKAAGASGIKIDFIPSATAEVVDWYVGALRDTAELKLLCNFHGAIKPSGLRRTWPNELTREAVRGQEYHTTHYNRTMPLDTDTIIPFTRFLQGPADYTPMVFDSEQLRGFTWSRELASAIVFTSPLMHYGDSYKHYLENPAEDILHALPTTWDETLVLPGAEIGKVVAFARRKGNDWYVGMMNGAQETRLDVNLSFLKSGSWRGTLLFDAPDKADVFHREERDISAKETIPLTMKPGGGFTAKFTHGPSSK